jgi:hypothetical protein
MAATKTRSLALLLAALVLVASCSQSDQRATGTLASPLAFMPSQASLETLGQKKGEILAGSERQTTTLGRGSVQIESMGSSILDSLRQSRAGRGFTGARPPQPRAPSDGLIRQRLGPQASQLSGHYGLLDNRVQVVFSNAEGADISQTGKIIRTPFAREGSRASKGEWHRDALLKFDVVKSKHLSLGVTGGFYDEQTTLYDGGRLNIGKATGWRKHQAQEGGVTLGILNNQLRYSGQFALSTSQEQSARDGSVVSDSGHGFEQRIDADLWKSETLTLSAYGRYKEAQSAYESASTWADDAFDLEDSFGFVTGDDKAIGNLEGKGETLGFGGAIAFGDGDLNRSFPDAACTGPEGLVKSRTSDQAGAQPAWRLRAIEGALSVTLGTTGQAAREEEAP